MTCPHARVGRIRYGKGYCPDCREIVLIARPVVIPFEDPISPREISEILCAAMDREGVNSHELGRRMRVSPGTIENWRYGRNLVKVAAVLSAFEALGWVVKIVPPKAKLA